ncbi:hypothetical protein J2T13_004871 [Paenibacillus sp. DS2015]|uniref:hypothetical protein n=1 Tax=Paenibacillus sp. DS2015 TaxID=3373917 RepID=UPI003D241672
MNDTLEHYKERIAVIENQGNQDPDMLLLLNHLVEDLEKCYQQNLSLRKAVLKSNSKESRMSTKLRDALME